MKTKGERIKELMGILEISSVTFRAYDCSFDFSKATVKDSSAAILLESFADMPGFGEKELLFAVEQLEDTFHRASAGLRELLKRDDEIKKGSTDDDATN